MFKYLIFIGCLLGLFSCKTYSVHDELPKQQLVWGSGGGFTGITNQYILLKNGQLFQDNGFQDTLVALVSQEKKVVKALFTECKSLHLDSLAMNYPGNLYYFIEYKSKKDSSKIIWGAPDAPVPDTIKSFYQHLQHLTKIKDNTSIQ